MQDKPTTVAAYAAGASLAAVALFYVFGPNYTIDGDENASNNRKKSIVGLANPANDCFINSVLQALAGLGDLRVYLIRELHRRQLDGPEIYSILPSLDEIPRGERLDKIRELQQGTITSALKGMLDRLNERPIYKKTISAAGFVRSLEYAFRMRLSRNQQDAQEFLQIVAERLCDEYHAGVKARQRARWLTETPAGSGAQEPGQDVNGDAKSPTEVEVRVDDGSRNGIPAMLDTKLDGIDNEEGFPFEGKMESQIECQFCHFKYKPNQTSFVNLTLQVPQKSSTTLSACFDGLLKTEYIEDFRCDKCRLLHALQVKVTEKNRVRLEKDKRRLDQEIQLIQEAIETDPECIPEGVTLPPKELAPKRNIARHMRITVFPKIIAIHLSRSIFDQSSSTKNAAKVSFPERLSLGGILNPKWFKLLAIVCHKGSHQSGHYESFRRNTLYAPFSTPDAFSSFANSRATSRNPSRAPSRATSRAPSIAPSPRLNPRNGSDPDSADIANLSRSASALSLSRGSPPKNSLQLNPPPSPSSRPETSQSRISFQSIRSKSSGSKTLSPTSDDGSPTTTDGGRWTGRTGSRSSKDKGSSRLGRRRSKINNRWWRISDEKIKECKTSDVLGMQKEVYLLFYEMEKPESESGSAV
ncbi:putative ubiquitin C-terminal hydrolase [Aspergillus chevalieri]|uniref:Ubiquitin carboxyl-terminal hydrolase n=1 Tax=Aspergillus chevalieri TaxID=182096 RepID=A0A7R7ZKF2_ASPCH|nr:ubiquitin-specific protease [Aspergillus chevalieri]BCR85700.1 ubiquitin-specific protease [Aspergillus chevalieri]